jgi:hypothetical protein
MVRQLRPLVYSLGLNNPPRICLTPRKSRVKILWRNKQGNCRCKMAGAEIRSFAKFRGQMYTVECQGLKTVARFVAFRGKFYQGVGIPQYCILASGGWHSAVHLRAVCQDVIPVVAIRCQRTAELGKWPNSSTCHFTSRAPLFVASYLCRATFRV